MLVLDRKVDQEIVIGSGNDEVIVSIVSVVTLPNGKHSVRLGFDAGRHITIDRKEVREQRVQRIADTLNGGRL